MRTFGRLVAALTFTAMVIALTPPVTRAGLLVTASDDTYSAVGDQPLSVSAAAGVLDNDSGLGLTAAKRTDPAHGTVTVGSGNGSFTYQPAAGYVGDDSFTYDARVLNLGILVTDTATVDLTVTAPPPTPTPTPFPRRRPPRLHAAPTPTPAPTVPPIPTVTPPPAPRSGRSLPSRPLPTLPLPSVRLADRLGAAHADTEPGTLCVECDSTSIRYRAVGVTVDRGRLRSIPGAVARALDPGPAIPPPQSALARRAGRPVRRPGRRRRTRSGRILDIVCRGSNGPSRPWS